MAPRQKIRTPFAEIDLNIDPNIDCGDRQLEKEPIHDLTVNVDESILEHDFDLNSPPNEISSSSHDMLLEEQLIEDDERLEEGIQANQTTLESSKVSLSQLFYGC